MGRKLSETVMYFAIWEKILPAFSLEASLTERQ